VLGEAVEQEEGSPPAHLGHVHAKPWEVDEAVLDTLQHGKRSVRGTLLRQALGASDSAVSVFGLHAWAPFKVWLQW
jgi:hypothetical protein